GSSFTNSAVQSAVVSGAGALSLVNGAIFKNAGSFLAQTDAGIVSGSGNSVFNNTGTFTRNTSVGIYVIATAFNNNSAGVVSVTSGALQFNGTASQAATGNMFVQGGSMTFNSSFVNDGIVTATGPATLTFNGPVTNNGTILVRGGATLGGSSNSFVNN